MLAAQSLAVPAGSPLTVFLVDDSLAVRSRVADALDAFEGIEVVGQAETVSDAIEGIAETRPAAVLLDLHLPDGSGLEVLDAMRAGDADARVIVLTNPGLEQYRRACLAAGAEHCLDKSLEFDRLFAILAAWASQDGPIADNNRFDTANTKKELP